MLLDCNKVKMKKHLYSCLLLFHPLQLNSTYNNSAGVGWQPHESDTHTEHPGGIFLAIPGPLHYRLTVSDGRILGRFCGSFLPGSLLVLFRVLHIPILSQGKPRNSLAGFPWWSLIGGRWSRTDLLCVCVLRQWLCCVFLSPRQQSTLPE